MAAITEVDVHTVSVVVEGLEHIDRLWLGPNRLDQAPNQGRSTSDIDGEHRHIMTQQEFCCDEEKGFQ